MCDDYWDIVDGSVVCQQLGYGPALGVDGDAYYGEGSGLILMDNVECSGEELSVLSCSHIGHEEENCGHHEDAGVRCTPLGGTFVFLKEEMKKKKIDT